MKKKILIIFGHPSKKTFNRKLMRSYLKGLKDNKYKIDQIDIVDLNLESFLKNNHRSKIKLTGNLLKAQQKIKWADHLVFFFPVWWATPPALLKVFLETVLQSGFAYKYTKPLFGFIPHWNKLLEGKTARIIATMGAPIPYHKCILGEPAFKMMKANLEFCGIKPVKKNYFGVVDIASENKKARWLERIYQIASRE